MYIYICICICKNTIYMYTIYCVRIFGPIWAWYFQNLESCRIPYNLRLATAVFCFSPQGHPGTPNAAEGPCPRALPWRSGDRWHAKSAFWPGHPTRIERGHSEERRIASRFAQQNAVASQNCDVVVGKTVYSLCTMECLLGCGESQMKRKLMAWYEAIYQLLRWVVKFMKFPLWYCYGKNSPFSSAACSSQIVNHIQDRIQLILAPLVWV